MREGGDVAIIAMGLMVAEALKAADLLAAVVAILFLRSERRVFYPSSGRRV